MGVVEEVVGAGVVEEVVGSGVVEEVVGWGVVGAVQFAIVVLPAGEYLPAPQSVHTVVVIV